MVSYGLISEKQQTQAPTQIDCLKPLRKSLLKSKRTTPKKPIAPTIIRTAAAVKAVSSSFGQPCVIKTNDVELHELIKALNLKNASLISSTKQTISQASEKDKQQIIIQQTKTTIQDKPEVSVPIVVEPEKPKIQQPTNMVAPPILNVAPSTKTSTISINDIWEKDANEYLEHIKNIKLKVKNELQKIPRSQLKEKFVLKMKVTTRIGQLQNSTSKIKEIVSAIDMILIDSKRTPIFYEWLMDITAKAMVKQSEKEVSVKRSLAFPLSTIALLLLDKHPQMLSILLGRVYKACPYAIPKYVQKVENESEIEYKKRLRYRMADDGIFEAEIQYAERITGIVCFYSALLQSEIQNPLGIAKAWEWLSRFLNMKPRRISAQLLLAFLEIAGNKLIKNYEAQARKIIRYISQVYIPMMPSSCSATKMRLELFLDDSFYKKGVIGEFEGCRPKN